MSDTAIKFEHVGKLYQLGVVGTGTLSHDLRRWWITSVRGKEDPYLKIGETNDRASKGHSDFVYALKDIDFEVKQGDVLGIIGKNGAGKSTLLKLLSRVTYPTTGKIYTKGRIASLLEVGTGFHPELTGRENIYMNGTILGMKKWEIDKKLDEIIDFSGCERYLDTPVKRYSSGMTVRLGFAIAAHLDPEILVVDEVLAVGDAEFQKKAIGKMQDVSKGEGRTVLFVSHNMASVNKLCKNGIVLENGRVAYSGIISDTINFYLSSGTKAEAEYYAKEDKAIQILSAKILNSNNEPSTGFGTNQLATIIIVAKNISSHSVRGNFSIFNSLGIQLMVDRFEVQPGNHIFKVEIDTSKLLKGNYHISLALDTFGVAVYDVVSSGLSLEIVDLGTQYSQKDDSQNGMVASFAKIKQQS